MGSLFNIAACVPLDMATVLFDEDDRAIFDVEIGLLFGIEFEVFLDIELETLFDFAIGELSVVKVRLLLYREVWSFFDIGALFSAEVEARFLIKFGMVLSQLAMGLDWSTLLQLPLNVNGG